MTTYPGPLARLIQELSKLPGIGEKTAARLAFHMLKSKKEDGQTVNIIAACATDIMLSNVQFSLKMLEPDKISRTFPGMPGMEISYYRCPI